MKFYTHSKMNCKSLALHPCRIWRLDWPRINANRNQISQVIHNLVHNAIDAMQLSNQGRVLRLKTERRGDDAIVVEIQDTGSGIDPKQLENIFEAFVTTKKGGTGLGLAIS